MYGSPEASDKIVAKGLGDFNTVGSGVFLLIWLIFTKTIELQIQLI